MPPTTSRLSCVSPFNRSHSNDEFDQHLAQDDVALRAACDAAQAGDWTAARDLMAGTRADFDRRARYVWVLGESVTGVPWAEMGGSRPLRKVRPVDPTGTWADAWAAAEPGNADAIIVRARSLIMRGWEARGSGWAKSVGRQAFDEFHRLLMMAVPLCHEAAELAPGDPTPWVQLLLLATALGAGRDDFEQCWAQVVARDPFHREAHNFKLMYLCQKWRGSHAEMFAFARTAAAAAPAGSALHVLPVQANAEWGLWELSREGIRHGRAVYRAWTKSPEFHAELDNALNHWFRAEPLKHAMWYHDLNYLAYGLYRGNRYADAKPVFAAIGPYIEQIPWAWAGEAKRTFRYARKRAG
jgi:hypothetical protein